MSKTKKVKGIPSGLRTVTPYLTVKGASKAIEFYKKAFGAREVGDRVKAPDGKIIHARIRIGNSIVMISDRFDSEKAGFQQGTLHIYSNDVDRTWRSAIAAGAKPAMQLSNTFWGERYGNLYDPFGNRWSVSTRLKMSKEEMERQRKKSMAMFNRRRR
ncbi:MAG: VOC family protein [Candidatus Micrarchaeota archaeon]|nr:VOC family protein [Candidatus Micrarchaeota archaeon]